MSDGNDGCPGFVGGKFGNGEASSAFSYAMTWGVKKYGPGGGSYSSGSTNMGDEGTAEERLATANKAKEVLATVYGKRAENIKFVDEYMGLEESSWLTPWKKIPKSFSSRTEFDKWPDEKAGRGILHAVTGPTRKITIYRSGVIGASATLYLPNGTGVTGTFTPLEFAAINMGHELWHANGSFGRETMMNDKPHTYSNLSGYSWCLALGGCRSLTIK